MGILNSIKHEIRIANYTTKLILINTVIFLVANILFHTNIIDITYFIGLNANVNDLKIMPYGLLTYMFLHLGLGHVFSNMLLLYFAGKLMEELLGYKRMLFTYIGGGIFGGLFFLILSWLIGGFYIESLLLGASASVLAIFVVCAIYMPELEILIFGVFPIRLKWLVLIVFLATTVIDFSVNTGGKFAHLGGALFGLIYAYNLKNGKDWSSFLNRSAKVKSKMKVVHKSQNSTESYSNQSHSRSNNDQETLDGLLDKIKKSGYDSLSKSEKELLNQLSRKI